APSGAHPACSRNERTGFACSSVHTYTAWKPSSTRWSTTACRRRLPCPRRVSPGAMWNAKISASVPGHRSGSWAGPNAANPATAPSSTATSSRCRDVGGEDTAERHWAVNAARASAPAISASTGSGRSAWYISCHAATCTSTIASTSSARAGRTKRCVDTAGPLTRSPAPDTVPIVPGTPGHRETAGAAEPRKTPESSIGVCNENAAAWEYQVVSIILRVIVNAIALWAAVLLVDGIEVSADTTVSTIATYLGIGALFGIVNAVIKPIVKTVGCIFYYVTLGLVALVVNALLLWLTAWLAGVLGIPFEIDGFWAAFWGAIIVAIVSWLLSLFVGKDDD